MNTKKTYTYDELREQALKDGVKDNKVHIGVWIQQQGYFKTIKQVNHVRKAHYFKIAEDKRPLNLEK